MFLILIIAFALWILHGAGVLFPLLFCVGTVLLISIVYLAFALTLFYLLEYLNSSGD